MKPFWSEWCHYHNFELTFGSHTCRKPFTCQWTGIFYVCLLSKSCLFTVHSQQNSQRYLWFHIHGTFAAKKHNSQKHLYLWNSRIRGGREIRNVCNFSHFCFWQIGLGRWRWWTGGQQSIGDTNVTNSWCQKPFQPSHHHNHKQIQHWAILIFPKNHLPCRMISLSTYSIIIKYFIIRVHHNCQTSYLPQNSKTFKWLQRKRFWRQTKTTDAQAFHIYISQESETNFFSLQGPLGTHLAILYQAGTTEKSRQATCDFFPSILQVLLRTVKKATLKSQISILSPQSLILFVACKILYVFFVILCLAIRSQNTLITSRVPQHKWTVTWHVGSHFHIKK